MKFKIYRCRFANFPDCLNMYISTSKKRANTNGAKDQKSNEILYRGVCKKISGTVRRCKEETRVFLWRNFKPPGENTGQQDTQNFLTRLWILYANSFLNDREKVPRGAKRKEEEEKKNDRTRRKKWNREKTERETKETEKLEYPGCFRRLSCREVVHSVYISS